MQNEPDQPKPIKAIVCLSLILLFDFICLIYLVKCYIDARKVFGTKDRKLLVSIAFLGLTSLTMIVNFSLLLSYVIVVFYQKKKEYMEMFRKIIWIENGFSPMFLIITFTFDLFKWIVYIASTRGSDQSTEGIRKMKNILNVGLFLSQAAIISGFSVFYVLQIINYSNP